ncbi:aspartyl protease family protein At5g10770-like [Wolffia australiana]
MSSSPLLPFSIVALTILLFGGCHCSHHTITVQTLIPSSACSSEEVAHQSLKVFHSEGPCAERTFGEQKSESSHLEFLTRDEHRAESLRQRRNAAVPRTQRSARPVVIPARSGIALGTGNYVVTLGIGTPKKDVTVVFDTGSDLTWVQCEPCIGSCYAQQGPIFDPRNSTSYKNISCDSPECSDLIPATGHNSGCSSGSCVYGVLYGDGSFSVGFYAQETITLQGTEILAGVKIGCGTHNKGLFGLSAGLLGLGRAEVSLVSQTASKYKRVFSYCLPSNPSNLGYLRLGSTPRISRIGYTPMLTDASLPSFYFVEIVGITVGGQKLSIPGSVFSTAGAIFDSGTVITRLPPAAYAAMRTAFREQLTMYPTAPALSILDTCYNFTGYDIVSIPKISFNFRGNVSLDVHVSGILYVAKISQACLAFAGNENPSSVAIIGNAQQKTYQVVYDLARGAIGLGAGGCS